MDRTISHLIAGVAAVVTTLGSMSPPAEAQRSASRASSAVKKASTALADRTLGMTFGLYTLAAPGIAVTGEDIDGTFGTSFGPGAGVMVGYGFNRTWSAYASLDVAKQATSPGTYPEGTLGLAHFEIGARANLPVNSPAILPYVTAAVGHRALGARVYDEEWDEYFDMSMGGSHIAFGGGVQYFLSPKMALDGGIAIGLGSLNQWRDDGDTHAAEVNGTRSIRLRAGVTWRP
jgi:hypothetical protein